MRKLDKLLLLSFIGPFMLTTSVATFILLIQYMLKYFEDFVGKDLGFMVFVELLSYFSINMLQVALPLGVLVSTLMTFGNLGENFELTAIKGSGISLTRALLPIFIATVFISIGAFFFNNHIVPHANLRAYSLLYDIRQKKPTMDLKEGVFYHGIPDYTIKAKEKVHDDKTLKGVLIYDHTGEMGNRKVILADSSRMYLVHHDMYLKLELYNGNYYSESRKAGTDIDQFSRTKFDRMDMLFSMSSFQLDTTDRSLFTGNRQMMNIRELTHAIDSMNGKLVTIKENFHQNSLRYFSYHQRDVRDKLKQKQQKKGNLETDDGFYEDEYPATVSSGRPTYKEIPADTTGSSPLTNIRGRRNQTKGADDDRTTVRVRQERKRDLPLLLDTLELSFLDTRINFQDNQDRIIRAAQTQARNMKNTLASHNTNVDSREKERNKYVVEKFKKYSQAFACIVMFLIGAPLGAIIKKGGLGVPTIVSIAFFITYYIFMIMGEKWAKEGLVDGALSVWLADLFLLPFGLFFLRQARIDARLFDTDYYLIWWDKMKVRYLQRKKVG
jgi:lipopolysaccharide export system permease protein